MTPRDMHPISMWWTSGKEGGKLHSPDAQQGVCSQRMSKGVPALRDLVTFDVPPVSAGERRVSRFLLFFEDLIKVPLVRCHHCGECILSSTAFVCHRNCPKQLRNGPCGGTGEDGSCEVYPDRTCTWYKIYLRSKRLHRMSLLYSINRIHNWNLEGTSAWLNVFRRRIEGPMLFVRNDARNGKELRAHGAPGKD